MTCAFGVLANATVFIVTLSYRKIRDSSSSALILRCIALDLYVSFISAPVISLLGYLGPKRWLPKDFCKFLSLGFYVVFHVHIWATCMLAFQRLIATLLPPHYAKFTRKRVLAGMIAFPWLFSVMMHLFPIFDVEIRYADADYKGGCSVFPLAGDKSLVKMVVFYTCLIYLPLIFNGHFLYRYFAADYHGAPA